MSVCELHHKYLETYFYIKYFCVYIIHIAVLKYFISICFIKVYMDNC
jgi:hypothetical protein